MHNQFMVYCCSSIDLLLVFTSSFISGMFVFTYLPSVLCNFVINSPEVPTISSFCLLNYIQYMSTADEFLLIVCNRIHPCGI